MYTLSYILKICTKVTEKTLKKTDIKQIDIYKMIVDTTLTRSTKILVTIIKIYCKKAKYLLDDSNELVILLSNQKKEKKITVKKKQEEDVYISDIIVPEYSYDNTIDLSMEPIREYEDTKDSTLLKSFNIPIKRKKIEDEVIEYDNNYYKEHICNIKGGMPFAGCKYLTHLNFNIPSFFNDKLKLAVETMRDETAIEQYNEMSIDDYNDVSMYSENEQYLSHDITYEDTEKFLDLTVLPPSFIFNDQIEHLDREDKAKLFFDLLRQTSSGKIEVKQEYPDSKIFCKIL